MFPCLSRDACLCRLVVCMVWVVLSFDYTRKGGVGVGVGGGEWGCGEAERDALE
jgi:hypothetical protein